MAVYQGVLETMSGGWSTTGRWTVREYVDIGGKHLRNVIMPSYFDELLLNAIGQEVALSTAGSRRLRKRENRIVAIRTPKHALRRPSGGFLLGASIGKLIGHVFMAPFLLLFLLGGFWVANQINELLGWAALAGVVILLIWWLLFPFIWAVRMFRAAGALSDLRPPLTESTVIG